MTTKNWIRVAVLAAIFAWPTVETYRYFAATRELAESQRVEQQVSLRLAQAKAATQVAGKQP